MNPNEYFACDRVRTKLQEFFGVFIVGIIFSLTSPLARSQTSHWDLVVPTTANAGERVPIVFNYYFDLSNPPPGVFGGDDNIYGLMNYRNKPNNLERWQLSVGALSGQASSASRKFDQTFIIPGQYIIGGDTFGGVQRLCGEFFCNVRSFEYPMPVATLEVKKSDQYIALHQDRAVDAARAKFTLDLFATASSMGSLKDAVIQFITPFLDWANTSWATVVGVLISTIVAGLFGGPIGLVLGTAYTFMAAYYDITQKIETKLANDPPSANYREVFEYSKVPFRFDLGLGEQLDHYFDQGFDRLTKLVEAKQGELASLERGQTALILGDLYALDAQASAVTKFTQDQLEFSASAGEWVSELPEILINYGGLDSTDPLARIALDQFNLTAAQLYIEAGRAPLPDSASVPEPTSLSLSVMAALIICFSRSKRLSRYARALFGRRSVSC